ncbi:MAG TPA: rod shape-determining protein MreD [Candidatus Dormibacteraeota bacterium]|nr:rod shape-determining protein MreD [Candidatus Dormibacteraeota bacterium]
MAALVLAAALIQLTTAYRFEVFGVTPNLVVVAVIAAVWTFGSAAGLAAACAGGLLLDLGSPGALGPHALALLPGAYVAAMWPRARAEWANLTLMALSAAVAALLYAAVLVALDGQVRLGAATAIYDLVLAPPAFLLVRAVGLGRITRRAQA